MALAVLSIALCSRAIADPAQQTTVGWQTVLDSFGSFIDQSTYGPGTQPPEGPAFARGFVLSPMTPYDTFSSAPMTPGIAGVGELDSLTTYRGSKLMGSLELGLSAASGSVTNASYWSESLSPPLNPHLGSQALPYAIVFPTRQGQDNANAASVAVLSASAGANDGSWRVRAGWLDLDQTQRFIFVSPPLTNDVPALAPAPAESLGNGPPALDAWPTPPPGLPLYGVDLRLHKGSATAEITNAALPALPGTSARMTNASIVLDRGQNTQFSAQMLHVWTGGTIQTTTLFGQGPTLFAGPQGLLPFSTLGGQQSTLAGVHAAFHPFKGLNAALDYGHSWYQAQRVNTPSGGAPGNYGHAALSHALGRASAGADVYWFGPRYATIILPYGAPENVWSVAWSWPGVWLKSTYQIADNTQGGANRQGYRLHYARSAGSMELHASFAEFHQIDPASIDEAHQSGFVEGFFLPQAPQLATLGNQKQLAAWFGWHPRPVDVSLDYVEDMLHRSASAFAPQDAVSLDAPQIVLTVSHSWHKQLLAAAGLGRFGMRGSWAHGSQTNVDFQQQVEFAGLQYAESPHAIVLLELRHSNFSGLPSIPAGRSPDFGGSLLVLEQRYRLTL